MCDRTRGKLLRVIKIILKNILSVRQLINTCYRLTFFVHIALFRESLDSMLLSWASMNGVLNPLSSSRRSCSNSNTCILCWINSHPFVFRKVRRSIRPWLDIVDFKPHSLNLDIFNLLDSCCTHWPHPQTISRFSVYPQYIILVNNLQNGQGIRIKRNVQGWTP